ncbi:hypothetical protein CABS03_05470 [Colletotrichum abscissum]|uniref:Uncharacterized protein n=1 Tax=Colletotrichum abscissum TaxID=1671311 RepID=A0A9P9X5H9_9PEZI|nr:hypothetical protein CABS02_12112 [Colletotrichum abscissum]
MKSTIIHAAVMILFGTASAVELACYGTGVPSAIRKGDVEYAIKNRSDELGIPGGTKFSLRWKTCTDPENSPKDIAFITTPSITREGSTKLANGVVACSLDSPPDSDC